MICCQIAYMWHVFSFCEGTPFLRANDGNQEFEAFPTCILDSFVIFLITIA